MTRTAIALGLLLAGWHAPGGAAAADGREVSADSHSASARALASSPSARVLASTAKRATAGGSPRFRAPDPKVATIPAPWSKVTIRDDDG